MIHGAINNSRGALQCYFCPVVGEGMEIGGVFDISPPTQTVF